MRLLHAENQIRPANVTFRDDDAGAGLRPCRSDLELREAFEQFFRGEAAKFVSAANEKQLLRARIRHI
jgi:hypothetical protein